MAVTSKPLQWLCSLLLLVGVASALKFELPAHTGGESHRKERCIRNFVNRDTMVAVKSIVGGHKGDGMVVNIHVRRDPFHVNSQAKCLVKANMTVADSRCSWQRVRSSSGRCRREPRRLYLALGRLL